MAKNRIPQDVAMQIADAADLPDGAYFAMIEELTGGDLDIPAIASLEERTQRDVRIDTAASALVVVLREQAKLLEKQLRAVTEERDRLRGHVSELRGALFSVYTDMSEAMRVFEATADNETDGKEQS